MKKAILLLCMLTFLCPTPIAANEISSIENTNMEFNSKTLGNRLDTCIKRLYHYVAFFNNDIL